MIMCITPLTDSTANIHRPDGLWTAQDLHGQYVNLSKLRNDHFNFEFFASVNCNPHKA
jgi:hypothetical protein